MWTRMWILATVAAASCAAGEPEPLPANGVPAAQAQAQVQAPRPTEVDLLIRMLLEQSMTNPKDLADSTMLPTVGPVYVRAEIPGSPGAIVTPQALPRTGRFVIKHAAELQAEADRTRKTVPFIAFTTAEVIGDRATAEHGVDIAVPTDPNVIKMCCCSERKQYVRKGATWEATGVVVTSCS
jgi:hypothetical protein